MCDLWSILTVEVSPSTWTGGIVQQGFLTASSEVLTTWITYVARYWFQLVLIASAILGVRRYALYRERVRNDKRLNELELKKISQLNAMRHQVFANITHEFKTPLTLVISPLKQMFANETDPHKREQLSIMIKNTDQLHLLINEVLELSKKESEDWLIVVRKQDLGDFATGVASNFSEYLKLRDITLEVSAPEKAVEVYFDRVKLDRVLLMIFSKIFGAVNHGSAVKLIIGQTSEVAEVALYFQQTSSRSLLRRSVNRVKEIGGSSADGDDDNLQVARELIRLHGGELLDVREKSSRRIMLRFPLGADHFHESQIIREPEYLIPDFDEEESQQFDEDKSQKEVILVAEDNEAMRYFIRSCFNEEYHVVLAENGKEALEKAREHIPDIVVTDLMMPVMDGNELSAELRKDERTSHIFQIMLTARAEAESMKTGFENGVNYYLTKPFDPEILRMSVANVLNARENYKNRVLSANALGMQKETVPLNKKDDAFLERIISIINENISEQNFQVNDLCREVGYSKSQLYRKLKGLIGYSANEFIRSIRLKKAEELIRGGGMNISEITYEVGFTDLQYFRSCFKKQYGMNPSNYLQHIKRSELESTS